MKPIAVSMLMPYVWPVQSIAEIGGTAMGILIITHHEQLLEHNIPMKTHVMLGGRIVETGGSELAAELHKQGYERIAPTIPKPSQMNVPCTLSPPKHDCTD